MHKKVCSTINKRLLRRQARGQDHCILGLSFKPNTDDLPEAPSVVIANLLTSAGAHVRAYDPVALEEAKHQLVDSITYCASAEEAVQGTDALALITEWTEFRVHNSDKVAEEMNVKVLFYGSNLYRRGTL